MANPEHLKVLDQGVEAWNKWRAFNPKEVPNLRGADFEHLNLDGVNFQGARLHRANLFLANFDNANLKNADFSGASFGLNGFRGADLSGAKFWGAELSESLLENANFEGADLTAVSFQDSELNRAHFGKANLSFANFDGAQLDRVNFAGAKFLNTIFGNNDLSVVAGLDAIEHKGPSTIGINTLYRSGGKIPEAFLRGCGVPDDFIALVPSLVGPQQAIHFYSCFISYSTKDQEFASRLYAKMRDAHLRVWFAPEGRSKTLRTNRNGYSDARPLVACAFGRQHEKRLGNDGDSKRASG